MGFLRVWHFDFRGLAGFEGFAGLSLEFQGFGLGLALWPCLVGSDPLGTSVGSAPAIPDAKRSEVCEWLGGYSPCCPRTQPKNPN